MRVSRARKARGSAGGNPVRNKIRVRTLARSRTFRQKSRASYGSAVIKNVSDYVCVCICGKMSDGSSVLISRDGHISVKRRSESIVQSSISTGYRILLRALTHCRRCDRLSISLTNLPSSMDLHAREPLSFLTPRAGLCRSSCSADAEDPSLLERNKRIDREGNAGKERSKETRVLVHFSAEPSRRASDAR